MIAILLRVLIGMTVLAGGAFAGGVRFHPEALSDHFMQQQEIYKEVKMTNGHKVVGKLLDQNEKGVTIEMGGGNVVIAKEEIASDREIPAEEIEAGLYSEWMVTPPKAPVFSYKEGDNLFMKMVESKDRKKKGKGKGGKGGAAAPQKKEKTFNEMTATKLINKFAEIQEGSESTSTSSSMASDSYSKLLGDSKTTGLGNMKLQAPSISNSLSASSNSSSSSGSGGRNVRMPNGSVMYIPPSAGSSSSSSGGGGYNGGKYGSDYMNIVNRAMSPEAMLVQAKLDAEAMQSGRNPIVECMKYGNCEDK